MTKNAAHVRGDIQRGLTGDKIAGFDPAAAPMETDAEAAGTPLTPEHIRLASNQAKFGEVPSDTNDPTQANAMLPHNDETGERGVPYLMIMVIFMVVLLCGVTVAAFLR